MALANSTVPTGRMRARISFSSALTERLAPPETSEASIAITITGTMNAATTTTTSCCQVLIGDECSSLMASGKEVVGDGHARTALRRAHDYTVAAKAPVPRWTVPCLEG